MLKTFFAKKISRSQEFFSVSLPRSKIHLQKKSRSCETERSLESVTRVPICFHDTRSLDEIENCRLRRRQQQPQKFEVDQSVVDVVVVVVVDVVAVVDVVFLSLGKDEIVQNKASVKNVFEVGESEIETRVARFDTFQRKFLFHFLLLFLQGQTRQQQKTGLPESGADACYLRGMILRDAENATTCYFKKGCFHVMFQSLIQ